MFFRTPRFIRRFFRARMHPMAEQKAIDYRQRISILYAIIAWNAGAYVIYQIAIGNKHWPVTKGLKSEKEEMIRPSLQWAKSLGIEKAEVIRFSGMTVGKPEAFEVEIETED